MKIKISVLSTLAIVLLSCTNDDKTNEIIDETYHVKGTVLLDNKPEDGIEVIVDNNINWKTRTDATGNFFIDGVSKGEHNLSLFKSFNSEIYSQKVENIGVYEDITIDNLILPTPLSLSIPDTEVTSESIELNWTAANSEDFYEYKLYRNEDAGLDETTGELVYVGTNINDTIFSDQELFSEKEYFYRVFLMNQFGKLGGSNIVSQTTKKAVLIPDGGFEISNSNTNYWNVEGASAGNRVTDSIAKTGSSCLYNQNLLPYMDGRANTYTVMSMKQPITVEPNRNYEISGWMRAEGEFTSLYDSVWIMVYQNNKTIAIADMDVNPSEFGERPTTEDTDWIFKSKVFSTTENGPITVQVLMSIEHVWIDDLKLTPL